MNEKKVKIFDREYELNYSVGSDEDADRIIEYVDGKYREASSHIKTKSLPDIALLVALNLAAELIEEKRSNEDLIQLIETAINNLRKIRGVPCRVCDGT